MRIPSEVAGRYAIHDGDTAMFLRAFDESPHALVLEVGAHDEAIANMLADCGFVVSGVDLREYDPTDSSAMGPKPPCNYDFLRADFCDLPAPQLVEWHGWFDAIIAISCIEHFGLGTYQEGKPHPYYDVIAMRTAWQLLRDGGHCYVTVPYGGVYIAHDIHWRVYNHQALWERIIQDFTVLKAEPFVADRCSIDGQERMWGDSITWEEANRFGGFPPHVSVLLKLKKVPINRLAPNGR